MMIIVMMMIIRYSSNIIVIPRRVHAGSYLARDQAPAERVLQGRGGPKY